MKKVLLSMLMLGAMTLTANAQNTGTKDAPLSVAEFLEQGIPANAIPDTYVQGYIVGYVEGSKLADAHFDLTPGATVSDTNLLLGGSSSENNVNACIIVQLPSGAYRSALNLAQHPENLYHEVILGGSHEKYFGANGLKSVNYYSWVGEAPVPAPVTPPSVEETGTQENPLTVAQYLALGTPVSPVADTWVTGYIVGSVTGKSMDNAEMGASSNSSASNVLIAASANPTSANECIPVQLVSGTDIRAGLNLLDNPDNVGKVVVLCGSREKYFGVIGLKAPTYYSLDGQTPDVPGPASNAIYSGLVNNANDWILNTGGVVPDGLNFVWAWDSQYGLKASAYYNETRYETNIWAVSPVIDLTMASSATLTFSQAANYVNNQFSLLVTAIREENGEWQSVNPEPLPSGKNWTFVDSSVDLASFVGKKIQIGFNYNSTLNDAATWQIKNLKVTGSINSGVEAVEAAAPVYALNGNIIAPAGARVFNLNGVETGLNNLPSGLYIVVVADKAVKVLVK